MASERMPRVPYGPMIPRRRAIKLRLDARTVIMLGNPGTLAFWKSRYPKAVIIG